VNRQADVANRADGNAQRQVCRLGPRSRLLCFRLDPGQSHSDTHLAISHLTARGSAPDAMRVSIRTAVSAMRVRG
jgi:hypothetical protein